MNNCVGSYASEVADGSVWVGAIYLNDQIICNYEFDSDGHCRQLLGKNNKTLDKTTHDELVSIMASAGALFEHYDYLGRVE